MLYTFSMCEKFYQMSIENYKKYVDMSKELEQFSQGKSTYDFLSHSCEENLKFQELYFNIYSCAISTIVFQALAVEAYMNFYGVKKIGENLFHDHYDRISIRDKFIILPKVATGKEINKGDRIYELFTKLFKARDRLVHFKSKSIDLDNCSEDAYVNFQNSNLDFVFDNIEELSSVYLKLKDTLAALENKPIDLFTEHTNELKNDLQDKVLKMFIGEQN